jgi:integrase/recombinase XerD
MRKSSDNRRALAFDDWPERDRNAWIEANKPAGNDLIDSGGVALRWRASSKELFVRYYGIWLAWLRDTGSLDARTAPGERVTQQRVLDYLRAQRALGVSAKTLVNNATSLRQMFQALAPEKDWTWMVSMISKLRGAVVVAKNHSDLPSIRELFELGLGLMRRAEDGPEGSPKQRAIMFRNGLMMAILAARPFMRRENLARIKIGKNLIREGGCYVLMFSGDEMKGKRNRRAVLPDVLATAIDRYIETHRPVLLLGRPEVDRTLFISMMGLPIYPHAMSNEIGDITQAAFGRRICAQEFRHAAASSIAKETPARVETVQPVLGHADFRTSETYYIFADEHAAFVEMDRTLTKLAKGDGQ